MNISQWKIGDRTFFSLEVDDRLLLMFTCCWSPESRSSAGVLVLGPPTLLTPVPVYSPLTYTQL